MALVVGPIRDREGAERLFPRKLLKKKALSLLFRIELVIFNAQAFDLKRSKAVAFAF